MEKHYPTLKKKKLRSGTYYVIIFEKSFKQKAVKAI